MSTSSNKQPGIKSCVCIPLLTLVQITILVSTTVIMASSSSVISDYLQTSLKNGEKCTVIVKMARETQEVIDQIEGQKFESQDEKATALTTGLKTLADESQKDVKAFLDSQTPPVEYSSMWINNVLVVKEATLELLQKLEKIGGIKEMREEVTVNILGGGRGGGIGVQ